METAPTIVLVFLIAGVVIGAAWVWKGKRPKKEPKIGGGSGDGDLRQK